MLKKARDYVHGGWRLAANPLYGNFKPNQQPYRTILLYQTQKTAERTLDFESLSLIENAIRVYEESPVLRAPGELPEPIDRDFRYLDFQLMRETMETYGILEGEVKRTTGLDAPADAMELLHGSERI